MSQGLAPKMLIRKKCKCGRSILVKNMKLQCKTTRRPVCSTCKTYGLEESKRLFALEDAEINRKSDKTIFEINGEKFKKLNGSEKVFIGDVE